MAASQSLRKGQVPIQCNLCETATKISWKCQDCDLLMCDGCKERIHIKIRNARNHKVVDIKEVGLQKEELDFSNICCKEHKGQFCVMFCKSCEQLVCTQCIAKIHDGHGLVEMSEGYQIKITKLRSSVDTLVKEKTKVKDIEKTENDKFASIKTQIQENKRNLYKEVDQCTEILLKEVDEKWNSFKISIGKADSNTTALKTSVKSKRQQIEELVNSNNVKKIFEECEKLEESLKEVSESLKQNSNSAPIFTPGEIRKFNVGSLQAPSSDITLQVIKEYTTDMSNVYYMVPCADGLWISNAKMLQKVQPKVNDLNIISNFDTKVYGMTVTPSDDLLLKLEGKSTLQLITASTNKITETNYGVDGLNISAVHVTRDYKVVVGVKQFGKVYPVTGRRALIVIDKEGKQKTACEFDRNNKRIFSYVSFISSTNKGNIFVVDEISDDHLRLVVLDQNGEIINIFRGHPDFTTENTSFQPVFLVPTPSDNIIVKNRNSEILYILDNTGHYKAHINTGEVGITNPYSIAFTKTGKVYIGTTREKGSTKNAKLYEVKLSWC